MATVARSAPSGAMRNRTPRPDAEIATMEATSDHVMAVTPAQGAVDPAFFRVVRKGLAKVSASC